LTVVPEVGRRHWPLESEMALLSVSSRLPRWLRQADFSLPIRVSRSGLLPVSRSTVPKCVAVHSRESRELLLSFLRNVIVHDDRIELLVGRTELRQRLNGDEFVVSNEVQAEGREDLGDTICLSIEAKWKRRDGALHLVVQPHATTPSQHPRAALIKAVVRGRVWCEKILDGQVVDLKSLARETDLTPNYVRHVLACAFLARISSKPFSRDVSRQS
jgi:hypothetical protein